MKRRKKTKYTMEQRAAMVRELAEDRGWRCERCGDPLPNPQFYNDHHLFPKRHVKCDLLKFRRLLCHSFDRTDAVGCHDWVENHPEEARKGGWLAAKFERPPCGECTEECENKGER